jgi:predicted Zn-dependent protease
MTKTMRTAAALLLTFSMLGAAQQARAFNLDLNQLGNVIKGVDPNITKGIGTAIKSAKVVARTFEDFTPSQEHYIGRTVGAMVLQRYHPLDSPDVTRYVNELGQTLAQASDRPETFGGYHFMVLDSDEINAFAAPGGLIFVTRGLIRCCPHEDALAAVLAHENGHVQLKHGLQAIHKSRVTSAFTFLGVEGARSYGREEVASLANTFGDSITDITATLINNGYSRAFELEADRVAVTILQRLGYNPNGLVAMLNSMSGRLRPGGLDFAKTHPAPAERMAALAPLALPKGEVARPARRQARFTALLGAI